MRIGEVFNNFAQSQGVDMLQDHLIQLWWSVQLKNEENTLMLISELSEEYEDPEAAEVGLIAVWNHLRG